MRLQDVAYCSPKMKKGLESMLIEPLNDQEFDNIRGLLKSRSGITIANEKRYLVENRLSDLIKEIGGKCYGDLYRRATIDITILTRLIDLMTTNETLWFRDASCWKVLEEKIVPELIQKITEGQSQINIWSAACSTGQESYSLSILIDELLNKKGLSSYKNRFRILGTDISQSVVEAAQRGRYDAFMMGRGMSPSRLDKYFIQDDEYYQLNDEIKKYTTFRVFNLKDSYMLLGKFDLILVRNVLIYFSEDFKKDILQRLSNTLTPDGSLLLGATETIFWTDINLAKKSHFTSVYYQSGS